MAYTSLFSLAVCFLVLFHGCFAQQEPQHPLRARTPCRIERLSAQEPNRRYESEAGVTEFWDSNNEQFECAGVEALRHVIQPQGLLLPYYTNAPQLIYIVQGRGIQGTVIPGCAETFESELQSAGEAGQRLLDRHQKIRRFEAGDVLALPAGVTHWAYNDGDRPLITVALLDSSNDANQLDQNFRKFFLAGNKRRAQQSTGQQEEEASNIFDGFADELLSEAFGVGDETVRRLKGDGDQRGRIVRAQGLQLASPEREQQQQEGEDGRPNGLEETLCTASLGDNIASPARADVYNPRGGRITALNSRKLPILRSLRLSVERGVLYSNAMLAPHWNMNAHSVLYVLRGNGRLQVVGVEGRLVFDGMVREGQLIVVPQNFAVLQRAGNQGMEYVAFKTNDNAMSTPLAGRLSAIRAMPDGVLMSSYRISREDARSLKYNRQELTVFGPVTSPRVVTLA